MSKKMTGFITVLFLSLGTSAWANQGPDARACRIAGGQPWTVSITDDEVELCRLGSAIVGAMAFYSATVLRQSTQATASYWASEGLGEPRGACLSAGGDLIQGTDSDGGVTSLCQFSDRSLIDAETLARGPQAAENQELTRKLGAWNSRE